MILRHKFRKLIAPLAVLAIGALAVAGCGSDSASGGSSSGDSGGDTTLTVVGYSVAREVYADLIPAFQATPEGAGVKFKESYAASGEQSRAVAAGLAADYVAFSLEPDVTRLVDAGLVDETGTPARTRASSATRSWSSSPARATRRASRTGPT